jgi:hypothetical protein
MVLPRVRIISMSGSRSVADGLKVGGIPRPRHDRARHRTGPRQVAGPSTLRYCDFTTYPSRREPIIVASRTDERHTPLGIGPGA